jgi:hypothetical protein
MVPRYYTYKVDCIMSDFAVLGAELFLWRNMTSFKVVRWMGSASAFLAAVVARHRKADFGNADRGRARDNLWAEDLAARRAKEAIVEGRRALPMAN